MDQELLRRLRLDFTKRETDLLSYIQTYFPDVSPSQLKAWQQTGALESMQLENETYYPSLAQVSQLVPKIKISFELINRIN